MWALSAAAGLLSVVTGLLPVSEARDVLARVAPILLFLVAVTVLAELAESAGVFDVAAVRMARLGRGSVLGLFGLVALLGTATTVLLSLDTTAVLLTPVVLSLALRLELNPLPFAFLAVWIANAASLLLPVSNLTNLLALDRLDVSAATFASRMALPAVVAAVGAVLVVGIRFAGSLRGRYVRPEPFRPDDRLQFCVAAVACVGFAPAVLLGAPAWAAASVGATVVALAAAVRQRHRLRWALVPWRLVLLTTGLFLVVSAVGRHGLDDLLTRLVGPGGSARVTAAAAAAANGVNNLPAYLALERSTSPGDLPALLVGVNVGPLVLLWGSLATLLWRERCRARGVHISARQFTLLGLAGVPVLLAATVLVLP
ncbi:MAG: arsenical pump rane protein [Frankiaceae bacterium]|jgi:arsenical pump membrane protein|nr:arsenical pump rane protein [Frankiaceae bacterium]